MRSQNDVLFNVHNCNYMWQNVLVSNCALTNEVLSFLVLLHRSLYSAMR